MADTNKVVYTSKVRIERQVGPMRLAYLPAEKEPVAFGVHTKPFFFRMIHFSFPLLGKV